MALTAALSLQLRDVEFNSNLLQVFMSGGYTFLVGTTVYHIVTKRNTRSLKLSLAIILTLYSLGMLHVSLHWWFLRRAFISFGDTSDSVVLGIGEPPQWFVAIATLTFVLTTLIADFVMIWRCWVVWGRNWRSIVISVLSLITETVFAVIYIILQVNPNNGLSTSNRNAFVNSAIVYYSLSLFTNLSSTVAIIYRIISISRVVGTLSEYRGIIEIIIESSALYTAIMIAYLPLTAGSFDFINGYPQALLVPLTGIVPTLIVARVALGIARPDSSWSQKSGIIFNHSSVTGEKSEDIEKQIGESAQRSKESMHIDMDITPDTLVEIHGNGKTTEH